MDPCPPGIWGITRTGRVMVDAEKWPKKVHLMFHSTNTETGLGPGTLSAGLAPGQMSPPATKYKETTWD